MILDIFRIADQTCYGNGKVHFLYSKGIFCIGWNELVTKYAAENIAIILIEALKYTKTEKKDSSIFMEPAEKKILNEWTNSEI